MWSFLLFVILWWIMTKFNSVKKNNDFKIIYKNGKVKANNLLVMYVINKENISLDDKDNIMYPLIKDKNNREKNRIGISASKKIGNSVVRHRVTRLLRECLSMILLMVVDMSLSWENS